MKDESPSDEDDDSRRLEEEASELLDSRREEVEIGISDWMVDDDDKGGLEGGTGTRVEEEGKEGRAPAVKRTS